MTQAGIPLAQQMLTRFPKAPPKPRLRRLYGSLWVCEGGANHRAYGAGRTPSDAYEAWNAWRPWHDKFGACPWGER